MNKGVAHLKDQRGIETLEWMIVGGLIAGLTIALYQVAMTGGLKAALGMIVSKVGTAMAGW